MFAGVRCGNFGEATSCESGSEEEAEKYCRVDMAWFYGVIQTLEKDFDVVYNTKVKFNSECFIHGDRIVNPYNHNYGQLDHREGYFKILRLDLRDRLNLLGIIQVIGFRLKSFFMLL